MTTFKKKTIFINVIIDSKYTIYKLVTNMNIKTIIKLKNLKYNNNYTYATWPYCFLLLLLNGFQY